MRLTREALLKFARDTAAERARVSRRIVCIYLTGSVASGDPLLGGTTDVDLVIVHDSDPAEPREFVRVTDEVHLDIAHYSQSVFHHPRHLRADPWLGPFIYSKPLVLHDTRHWFDFLQAATGAQFWLPEYTMQRAQNLAQSARQAWMDLEESANPPDQPKWVHTYLRALEDAGNAIASLSGPPLTDRRFFTQFPMRAQAVKHPELSARLVEMVTAPGTDLDPHWQDWVQNWKAATTAAGQGERPPHPALPARRLYYERATEALWQEHPIAALWVLLRCWTDAVSPSEASSPEGEAWCAACQTLHLDEPHFGERHAALDHLLDSVEETLDSWGKENGVPGSLP